MLVSSIQNRHSHRGWKNWSHGVVLAVAGVLLSTCTSMAEQQLLSAQEPSAAKKPQDGGTTIDDWKSREDRTIDPSKTLAGSDGNVPHYVPSIAWLDNKGVLHVQGTYFNDCLRVESDGSTVEVTIIEDWIPDAWLEVDLYQTYDAADVVGIRMYGLAGDDKLKNDSAIPDVLFGGLGDDDLFGGDGVTYAFGQSSRSGCAGHEWLWFADRVFDVREFEKLRFVLSTGPMLRVNSTLNPTMEC